MQAQRLGKGQFLVGGLGALLRVAEKTITSAQLLTLRATPITLVAAPGAGSVIELLGGIAVYDYNSAAYVEATDNMAVRYTNTTGAKASEDIEASGFLDSTSDKIIKIVPVKDVLMVANAPLVLHNIGTTELTTGNSPVRVKIAYRVHKTGL